METEVSSEVSSENVVTSSELTSENASDDAEAVRDVFAMDTYMTVKAYGSNGDAAVDAAVDEINRLDALLSTGKKDSEIGQINANNGGQLSEDGAVLMERSLDLYKSTNGAFDVAIYRRKQLIQLRQRMTRKTTIITTIQRTRTIQQTKIRQQVRTARRQVIL